MVNSGPDISNKEAARYRLEHEAKTTAAEEEQERDKFTNKLY